MWLVRIMRDDVAGLGGLFALYAFMVEGPLVILGYGALGGWLLVMGILRMIDTR